MINGLLAQVNALRSQNNLPPLQMDAAGMKDAEIRATQFIDYMSTHVPGSPGFNPHEGYDTVAAGLGYNMMGENLAYMASDPAYIVCGVWQDSLHLAAMLSSQANVAGVSCIDAGTLYWTFEPGQKGSAPAPTPNPPPPVQTPPTPTPTPSSPSGPAALDSEEAALLNLINTYRAQNGAGPLQVSAALENSALWMSNDMATNNYGSHTDSLGRDPHTRMAAFGYPYSPWGENIAGGYSDAPSTFNQWVSACDPDVIGNCTYAHRQNMLYGGYVVIGIGRAYSPSSTYGWYWTTDFGGYLDQTLGAAQAPVINSFTATPSAITAGQAVTLSWNVSGATTVSIDNGVGDVSKGTSKAVSPSQTVTCTLTATNGVGSTTAMVTVTVASNPTPQNLGAPVIVSAAAKSAVEIDLAWTAGASGAGIASYLIIRNGIAIVWLPASTLSYSDFSVLPSTTYSYLIRSYDVSGNYSPLSNSAQATTLAASSAPQACPAPATGSFTGCYYPNTSLAGAPALVRTDPQIMFDWGAGSPASSLPAFNFSARWQGYFPFDQGTYIFNIITSDGMRIYIDNQVVWSSWRDQPPYMYTITQSLSQGSHLVTIEYYERTGGAAAQVSWQKK
jgi:uncharacterized protein YkwD